MKYLNTILGSSLVLFTMNLQAAPREFRIVSDSVTKSGLALAWGTPGQKTDFEGLEAAQHEMTNDESEKLRNFVVDIEKDTILMTLPAQENGIRGNYNVHGLSNHLGTDLIEVPVQGLYAIPGPALTAAIVMGGMKWNNWIAGLLIVSKDENGLVKAKSYQSDLSEQLGKATEALLTAKQKKYYAENPNWLTISLKKNPTTGWTRLVVEGTSYAPKSDAAGLSYSADLILTIVKGTTVQVSLKNFKAKIN